MVKPCPQVGGWVYPDGASMRMIEMQLILQLEFSLHGQQLVLHTQRSYSLGLVSLWAPKRQCMRWFAFTVIRVPSCPSDRP